MIVYIQYSKFETLNVNNYLRSFLWSLTLTLKTCSCLSAFLLLIATSNGSNLAHTFWASSFLGSA